MCLFLSVCGVFPIFKASAAVIHPSCFIGEADLVSLSLYMYVWCSFVVDICSCVESVMVYMMSSVLRACVWFSILHRVFEFFRLFHILMLHSRFLINHCINGHAAFKFITYLECNCFFVGLLCGFWNWSLFPFWWCREVAVLMWVSGSPKEALRFVWMFCESLVFI